MKFSQLTRARQQLNSMAMEKEAGVLGMAARVATKPARMAHNALWGASKRTGGAFAPLIYGGTVLGGAAIAKKSMGQAKNYAHGFNPQLQDAIVRG